ncbi:MAG: DUF2326 domain-containing protein [Pseudomonas sp.]|uniref:DUF2326 domain-containing protein n=1 Tax=Pseudomonas sp. TaxID=306 RepID=UPI002715BCAC|nr:DUF2326 domain-containing protein [Pseudomonas sp.]MDO8402524.1 DUF2326 domain-containing protein [Pseudomonas sp.]
MKLISIEIKVDGESRRIVRFHDGLNLVTNRRGVGRSGNSVGKSTLSRVFDFLFLGSIDSIYIDEEFKRPNQEIEGLFIAHYVVAELAFLGVDGKLHQLERNFSIGDKNSRFIFDGRVVDAKEYESSIQKYCFDIFTRRPTVRSVAAKFVRNDSHRMLNTTHFLDVRAAGKEYGELYLYLFGFQNTELLTQKRDASNTVGRRKRQSQALNALVKEQKPTTEIGNIKRLAVKLEDELLKFDYSPEYSNPVELLQEIQKTEDDALSRLLAVDRKLLNIAKTVEILEAEEGGYLGSELRAIYQYAGVNVDSAIRDLESVVGLHETLVGRKKQFLEIGLSGLINEKDDYSDLLKSLQERKLRVFSDMRSADSIASITEKLRELGKVKVELGKLEGLMLQQGKAKTELVLAEELLSSVVEEIVKELKTVYEFEKVLDLEFKAITRVVHGEEYGVGFEFDAASGTSSVVIENEVTNPEGGKKKAEVIAFDFAYIKAVNLLGIKRPKFVFHDSIEDIDQKQVEEIFVLSKTLPGQQILSMLSDKFSDEVYKKYERDVILYLDDGDRFFKI